MTAAPSAATPLILIVLALGISFLSAVGSIAAVLMARANLFRQIQVTAREGWMREFREQVAEFCGLEVARRKHERSLLAGNLDRRPLLIAANDAMEPCKAAIRLLIAEKGAQYELFVSVMEKLAAAKDAVAETYFRELTEAAAAILRCERAAIEDLGMWRLRLQHWRKNRKLWKLAPRTMATLTGDEAPSDPWSRFVAWLCRPPPRFPT
jgi:hypothetical protein